MEDAGGKAGRLKGSNGGEAWDVKGTRRRGDARQRAHHEDEGARSNGAARRYAQPTRNLAPPILCWPGLALSIGL